MKLLIIIVCSLVIAGYSTTDILRLTSQSNTDLLDNVCYCLSCGYEIPLYNQIPIVSYVICKGKCIKCGKPIPKASFINECILFVGSMAILWFDMGFLMKSALLFSSYQVLKVINIYVLKPRPERFMGELMKSILINIPVLNFPIFVIGIYGMVVRLLVL